MARTKPTPKAKQPTNPWASLTWDHLGRSFDSGSVRRGRDYQKQGRVAKLQVAEGGMTLLATVRGGESYSVRVDLGEKSGTPEVTSLCTCFVGFCCKHGVATVAEYLQAVAEGRTVAEADPNDPRWEELEAEGDEASESFDEDGDPFEADEDDAAFILPPSRPQRRSVGSKAKRQPAGERAIEDYIRGRSASELADLVLALAGRIPAVAEELREQVALARGDASHFLMEAKQAIRQLKSPRYGDDDETESDPPFGRIGALFDKLLMLGLADEVVILGREYIPLGLNRAIETIDYDSRWSVEFSGSLPVIFRAVNRSSLTAADRLIVAIDAILADSYDYVASAACLTLDVPSRPEDWSRVADTLLQRLAKLPPRRPDDYTKLYARENLVEWIDRALETAGRGNEQIALAEAEAEASGSFEPVVDLLLAAGRLDDAERWIARGIAATVDSQYGVARGLAGQLLKLAQGREDWPTVAAHRAWAFFDAPNGGTWDALMADARRAGVEEQVRRLALNFLETGIAPVRFVAVARPRSAPGLVAPTASKGRAKAGRGRVVPPPPKPEPPGEPALVVADGWPLPVPDALVPLVPRPNQLHGSEPKPRYDVLVDLAIARNQPDEVLRWFDRSQAERPAGRAIDPDRVAAAVAASHPERAAEIYTAGLSRVLLLADIASYEAVARYLRHLRPIYDATGRADEWTALVASIRAKHRNRPRLLEALDRLDGVTILDEAKKQAGGR